MKKSEDNPDVKVLKTATCPTLSGKSTLTYQVGLSPRFRRPPGHQQEQRRRLLQ